MNGMELFLTVLSGVIVFIVSQAIIEKFIKPRAELRKIKGKIICYLTMYSRDIFNPLYLSNDKEDLIDNYWKSSCELRFIASELSGQIECYPFICNKKKYEKVVNNIMRISNEMVIRNSKRNILDDIEKSVKEICEILGINNLL